MAGSAGRRSAQGKGPHCTTPALVSLPSAVYLYLGVGGLVFLFCLGGNSAKGVCIEHQCQRFSREDGEDLYKAASCLNGKFGFLGLTDFIELASSLESNVIQCFSVMILAFQDHPLNLQFM